MISIRSNMHYNRVKQTPGRSSNQFRERKYNKKKFLLKVCVKNSDGTLTEHRRPLPHSISSTDWHIALSNIMISRVTLIAHLSAHPCTVIPQHTRVRQARRRAAVDIWEPEHWHVWCWKSIYWKNLQKLFWQQVSTSLCHWTWFWRHIKLIKAYKTGPSFLMLLLKQQSGVLSLFWRMNCWYDVNKVFCPFLVME